jgi:hypothetical protein
MLPESLHLDVEQGTGIQCLCGCRDHIQGAAYRIASCFFGMGCTPDVHISLLRLLPS